MIKKILLVPIGIIGVIIIIVNAITGIIHESLEWMVYRIEDLIDLIRSD